MNEALQSKEYIAEFEEIISDCIKEKKLNKIQAAFLDGKLSTYTEFGFITLEEGHEIYKKILAHFDFTQADDDEIIR